MRERGGGCSRHRVSWRWLVMKVSDTWRHGLNGWVGSKRRIEDVKKRRDVRREEIIVGEETWVVYD